MRMTIAALPTLTLVVLHSTTGFNVLQDAFKSLGRQRHDKITSFSESRSVPSQHLATSLRAATEEDAQAGLATSSHVGRMNESISQTTKIVYS